MSINSNGAKGLIPVKVNQLDRSLTRVCRPGGGIGLNANGVDAERGG